MAINTLESCNPTALPMNPTNENELLELSDKDRATLHAMAQKYGFGNDIAEFFAQLMVDVFES
jgi:hypothetical protein